MHPPANSRCRAFSLVELLVVLAVVVMVTTLIVPAVSNFGRSTGLATGGNMVANLTAFARQTAITKSTLTALILLGQDGTEDDYRAFTVIEYDAIRGWFPISEWQKLPTGIIVDRTGEGDLNDLENGTFLKYSPTSFLPATAQPTPPVPPVLHRGRQVTRFAARIFSASGSLLNPQQPAQLRLVEGFLQGNRVVYTRPGQNKQPANYYDIAIIGTTGIGRIDRP